MNKIAYKFLVFMNKYDFENMSEKSSSYFRIDLNKRQFFTISKNILASELQICTKN